jgi:hypothetical protein
VTFAVPPAAIAVFDGSAVIVNSLALSPPFPNCPTFRSPVPEFVIVTLRVPLVVPTACGPNDNDAGVTPISGEPTPVPFKLTVGAAPEALLFIVTVSLFAPVDVGVNVNNMLVDAVGATTVPFGSDVNVNSVPVAKVGVPRIKSAVPVFVTVIDCDELAVFRA